MFPVLYSLLPIGIMKVVLTSLYWNDESCPNFSIGIMKVVLTSLYWNIESCSNFSPQFNIEICCNFSLLEY